MAADTLRLCSAWCLWCWVSTISWRKPCRTATWKPPTGSVASPSPWGRHTQGTQTQTGGPDPGALNAAPSSALVFQAPAGAGGTLATVPGSGQHDSLVHGRPWVLPSQRDQQLPDPHLLVHPAGQSGPGVSSAPSWLFPSPNLLSGVQDDILSFDEDRQAVFLQVYRPVYFQLVDVLLCKCQYPPEEDYSSWSPEDKEQFRTYR